MTKIKVLIGAGLLVALAALQIGQSQLQEPVVAANNDVMAPHFLVDPLWPKPLPNHWVQGNTIGVEIPEYRSIDIDTQYDFEIADYLYKKQMDLC